MSRETTTGRGGVASHFGPRSTDEKGGGTVNAGGRKKQVVYTISYDDLPTAASTDDAFASIPAGAIITEAYASATTTFAGGTSYDIGLIESDGTAVNADGLWDALTLAQVNADDVCSAHAGTDSGALLNSRLANAAHIVVAEAGTFTAGVMTVTVEYLVDTAISHAQG